MLTLIDTVEAMTIMQDRTSRKSQTGSHAVELALIATVIAVAIAAVTIAAAQYYSIS